MEFDAVSGDPVQAPQLGRLFGYSGGEADYLCNIGLKRGFLYVETPKVACSTIKRTLQEIEAGTVDRATGVHDKAASPLCGAIGSGLTLHEIFRTRRLFRFTFVRNPYTRILSCYLEKILVDANERRRHQGLLGCDPQQPVSFVGFLRAIDRIADRERDVHWRSQSCLIGDLAIEYHLIGRFEALRRDLSYILRALGERESDAAILDVRHHRTDAATRIDEFFGPEEQALVGRIYRADFLRYGYSLNLPGRPEAV